MKEKVKKPIALLTAFMFAFTGAFMFNGVDDYVYADVGPASDSGETTYDKGGGVLGSLGIDTSKVPETYDADSTDNPYGSDVTTLVELNELVKIDTSSETGSTLYGHDGLLTGNSEDLFDPDKNIHQDVSGPGEHAFLAGTDIDVTGNGRDEAAAIVYSNYHFNNDASQVGDPKIYMKIYNPKTGRSTEAFELSSFIGNKVEDGYIAQSQMQIAAGDFDNDTVEEIAVYVPSPTETGLPRVAIYDLTNGTDCSDPYQKSAWQNSWNYVLPKCSGAVNCQPPAGHPGTEKFFIPNFYNNIDLKAGDADNDGACDLIVSYGASDVWEDGKQKQTVIQSLPSRSVILYGSNGQGNHGGQMLRDSQELDYGGNELIRVSFAFGDLDGDGNEETIMGGQLRSEQDSNKSRVLGKYIYDPDSDGMITESTQNLEIVSGTWHEDPKTHKQVFSSANGWDGHYYSIPAMKTNLAVGDILGEDSQTKIYMDSVLYSYDNSFSLVDELEDASLEDPNDADKGTKGSAIFTDITGVGDQYKNDQMEYFEYGAFSANYTMSQADYLAVHRVSGEREGAETDKKVRSDATFVVPKEDEDGIRLTKENTIHDYKDFAVPALGAPVGIFTADTDIDSAVALYTGVHEINYKNPKVLAVLASAPYFKDVADYDGGHMLDACSTTYGKSTGDGNDFSSNLEFNIGIYSNNVIAFGFGTPGEFSVVGVNVNKQTGFQYTYESSFAVNKSFEVTYGTAGGENEVAFFSTPTEDYTYLVTAGAVDADGNVTPSVQIEQQAHAHQPVTKTMPVDDYMEIQKRYPKVLPDVTKYVTSVPGDPSSYPSDENSIPKAVDDSWDGVMINKDGLGDMDPLKDKDYDQVEATKEDYVSYQKDAWEGAGFGNGFITQTISKEVESSSREGYGGYEVFEIGAHSMQQMQYGAATEYNGDLGLHTSISGDRGTTYSQARGTSFSGTVANMPESAKGYGYDFSWSLMKYLVHYSDSCVFPVITYMTTDVKAPPKLPDSVRQDFDKTTDSQIALVWTYSEEAPWAFEIYRYMDFPQRGGDELDGTVSGSDYTIRKDASGNTITDSNGKPIREYTFVEDGLTADTKYSYRLKALKKARPTESIFSPIIEARTDVSVKPDIKLSADQLTIYPDGTYQLSAELADPEHYEKTINYQWQKYSTKNRTWEDMGSCTGKAIAFTGCKSEDAGEYRCRVNLIRKRESAPQYISTYTDICKVEFGMREVAFGPITVFEGTGSPDIPTHTGLKVEVKNTSSTSTAKPSGKVNFTLSGPNGDIGLYAMIDEKTGLAVIPGIEDLLSTLSQQAFVDGGYLITADYEGDNVFKPAVDPEEYHYLRNIDECTWLQTESAYAFGKDIMPTAHLYDYKKGEDGAITRTDITDQIKVVKIFAVDEDGAKTGDAVAEYTLAETDGTAIVPLNGKLKKKAWIEAYTAANAAEAAGHQVISTLQMKASLSLSGKTSGCGELLKLYSFEKNGNDDPDVTISGDGSLTEKNMIPENGGDAKSLSDLMMFNYYQDNGEFLFSSVDIEAHPEYKDQIIPARYKVALAARDKNAKKLYETFYDFRMPGEADFLAVGSYYEVTAASSDEAMGSVRMISPILLDDIDKVGFSGGSKITLKAYPAEGFRIKEWKIEDGQGGTQYQSGGDLLIYTLRSDPTIHSDGQVKITATFEPKNSTLTYEAKGQGSLTVDPAFASGSAVLEGTQMQFAARADEGWHFKEWRWENYGGNSTLSAGEATAGGINSKTYTMGDTAAAVYAIFLRDTIDLDLQGDLTASYINNGENPLEETGKEIAVEKGRNVPKGTKVRVKTAPGFVLGEDAQWNVTVTTPDGTSQVEAEAFTEGGSEGCTFTLPDDVTACSVETVTEKGYYSIGLEGDNVSYVIKLDDTEIPENKYDEKLQRIPAGTHVEIQAIPDRGKLFDDWIVDGERLKKDSRTYSFTLMDSVDIEAAVKDDTAHTVKIKAEGGGSGLLVITGHDGKPVETPFGADEKTVTAYEGESLAIAEAPDDPAHIMTAVTMNGERQDLTDGVFTLESVTDDADFVCRFQPTTYCTVSFQSEVSGTQPKILDSTGRALDEGETLDVGTGETLAFSVVVDKNDPCHVSADEGSLELKSKEEDETTATYHYELRNINKNAVVTIDDQTDYVISNWDEFDAFMKHLNEINANGSGERPQAIVTADITMPEDVQLTPCTGQFNGTLDGQGHTIKGLRLGAINDTGTAFYNNEPALFNKIGSSGCVKNLTIEDFQAYYEFIHSDGERSTSSDTDPAAMITQENKGTISGIMLKDCLLYSCMPHNFSEIEQPVLAGIAVSNKGTVEACQAIGLKLYADRYQREFNTVGCAGVFKNEGQLLGCYVEGLKIWNRSDNAYIDATRDIFTMDGGGNVSGNYFRTAKTASAGTTSGEATNVLTITDEPGNRDKAEKELNSPAFAAKLAWHMNSEAGELWGVPQVLETPGDEPAGDEMITPLIEPLDLGLEGFKAPVRAEFTSGDKKVSLYLYPDEYHLPGEASFGDDTPAYWQSGDQAYSADFGPVEILKDVSFTGVAELTECVAKLTIPQQGTVCYKQLKDAFAAAEGCTTEGARLDIVADCTMDSGTFTINQGMTVEIDSGVSLTMKKAAQINNNGTFDCAQGGTLHKRGTMVNTGTIKVDGDFYNYGSKLKNTGTIENQKDIKCKPHCMGAWQVADAPNEDGTWTKTSVCEVCTNEITKNVEPDPPVTEIDSIEVFKAPVQLEYVEGDLFTTQGMIVAANMKDGGKAVITKYDLTISDGDPKAGKPIKDGDPLEEQGAKMITAAYEGFACDFVIKVTSGITALAIADGPREMVRGETLQLVPEITPADAPAKITWTSSSENIATVDENGLVTGFAAGQTVITASCDGLEASCVIKVHEPVLSLELDQEEILVPKDGYSALIARVTPAEAEGEITWTISDTNAAGFYVMDEETGKMVVTDQAVTALSPGSAAVASSYIMLTGIEEGEAVVTASINDARGYKITKKCKVQVRQADAHVTMTNNGVPVSGMVMKVDRVMGAVQFNAESSEPDDILQWSTTDDAADPVISVDDTGLVSLLRSGTAAVNVTSAKTGVSDICILKVVKMPTAIDLSGSKLTLPAGTVKVLTADLDPADADGSVVWSSSDETIAKISSDGVITGVSEGKATITAQATADPSITAECQVTVLDPKLTITLNKTKFYFDGKEKFPLVTVKSGNTVLADKIRDSNTKVLLIYDGERMLPGKHTVTATARDQGMGSVTATYKIVIKPTKIKKLKAGKKKFTVKWKKLNVKYARGYQIRYSLKKNMKKSKVKTVTGASRTKLTVKNLKSKKTYYVQVRTIKRIQRNYYKSEWSKVMKVRVK